MRLAVSALGPKLSSHIDPNFSKCRYLIFIDPETMEFEPVENPNLMAIGGTGVQTAQLVANEQAQVVITGHCGPNTIHALTASGIQIFSGVKGRVEDVVAKYNRGELQAVAGAGVGKGVTAPGAAPELTELWGQLQALSQRFDGLRRRIEKLERQGR
jgi:predicted Fe-Mo cluster-binding NifX family protein